VQDLEGIKQERTVAEDETALVTLSLNVPTPLTRALDDAAEGAINRIDVLLFKGGDLYYRAGVSGAGIIPDGSTPNTQKNFTVRLPIGDGYEAVVLANAESTVSGHSVNSIIAPGTSRAQVIDNLAMVLATETNKWTDAFTYIPMWGYLTDLDIAETSTVQVPDIPLTRSIARVDVSVGEAGGTGDAVRGKFEIKHVYLYNYNRAGSLAPATSTAGDNVDGYNGAQWNSAPNPPYEKKAFAPHLPSLVNLKVNGPLEYIVAPANKHAFAREIYAFEAAAGDPVTTDNLDWKDNTCLVIGGKYDGGSETFYRVEFRSGTDPGPYTYLALLRNHLYNVVITEVNGHGYPRKEDAYNNLPSNIVVEITEWNDGGMNDVVFNGQHYLAVDKSRVTLYRMGHREGHQKTLKAKTNYGGWSIEIPAEHDWLDVSPMTYTGDDTGQTITVRVKSGKELVPGSGDRSGCFYIVVGNLEKKITVAQLDELEFWVVITDPSGAPLYHLSFEAGKSTTAPLAQPFRVTWFPSSVTTIGVATSPGTYPFLYAPGSTTDFTAPAITDPTADPDPDSDETRSLDFTVQPPSNAVTEERAARLDFSVTLEGQVRTLPIFLRQAPKPFYEFSPDGATLTLFAEFPHGTKLDGMNTTNIPELADLNTAAGVTKLVIEGDIDNTHIPGIKDRQSSLSLSNLESILLSDFTGTIPREAFYQCAWLKRFEAPLVEAVDRIAFAFCTSLEYVYLPAARTIAGAVFSQCLELTTVTAPNVTVIESNTFGSCSKLTSVDYLPNVTVVGSYAFSSCESLETLNLLAAQSIGEQAFQGTNLKVLKLGYAGTISFPDGTANYGIFGTNSTQATKANTIALYLHANHMNEVSGGKFWGKYEWKSITALP
jgi:hypothetical protein